MQRICELCTGAARTGLGRGATARHTPQTGAREQHTRLLHFRQRRPRGRIRLPRTKVWRLQWSLERWDVSLIVRPFFAASVGFGWPLFIRSLLSQLGLGLGGHCSSVLFCLSWVWVWVAIVHPFFAASVGSGGYNGVLKGGRFFDCSSVLCCLSWDWVWVVTRVETPGLESGWPPGVRLQDLGLGGHPG